MGDLISGKEMNGMAEEGKKQGVVEHADDINTKNLADRLGVEEDTIQSQLYQTRLEQEQSHYHKTDLTKTPTVTEQNGRRLDDMEDGSSVDISDGILTKNEDGTIHCKSEYLGEFDYDPELFAYGYKELREADGSVSQLPILKYVGHSGTDGAGSNGTPIMHSVFGDKLWGGMNFDCDSTFALPEGLKSADYTFEGNKELIFQPRLPDSLVSAHYGFANCEKLEYASSDAKDGESWLTNAGGEIYFPEGMKDTSCMYKNSKKFKGDFGEAPPNIVHAVEMAAGTQTGEKGEGLFGWYEHKELDWDGTQAPGLSKSNAKNMVNDVSNERVKEAQEDNEYYIEDDGTISEEKKEAMKEMDVDEASVKESQSDTAIDYHNDVADGKVHSEVEIATNDMRSDNLIYNGATGKTEYDLTGELKSDDKEGSWWQRLVIDGGAGLGIGLMASKLTDSKLIGLAAGIGGAYLLDHVDVLPETLSPILTKTAEFLPDGGLKDQLLEWADDLSGSTINQQKLDQNAESVAHEHQAGHLSAGMEGLASVNVLSDEKIGQSMYNNGGVAASRLALWSTAVKGESSASCVNEKVVKPCTDAMEQHWSEKMGKDGKPDEALKSEMKSYYESLFGALSEYNQGAMDSIQQVFANNEPKKELSIYGLHMVNRTYVSGVMDSITEMNEKYQLYTPEELTKLQETYAIPGIGDLNHYKNSFQDVAKEEGLEVDSWVSVDTMEEDSYVPDYGMSKDSVQYKESVDKEKSSEHVQKEETQASSKQQSSERSDRAAALDAQYGDSLEKKEPDVSQQLE